MLEPNIGRVEKDFAVLGTPEIPIYLLRGAAGWFVIEGGISGMAPLVLRQLDEFVRKREEVVGWIVTHSHYDHCGLLGYLAPHLPSVTLYASGRTAAAFQSASARSVIENLNRQILHGYWPDWRPDHPLETAKQELDKLEVTVVSQGDRLDLGGGHSLDVVSAPGHSGCQLTLFSGRDGRAFVSDALGEVIGPAQWCPLAFESLADYHASIERIRELQAAELCLAHRGRLTGESAHAAPDEALEALQRFAEQGELALNDAGGDLQKAAERLSVLYENAGAGFVPRNLHVRSMLRMLNLIRGVS